VKLTDAGRVFLTEARAVLQRVDEGVQAARTVATGVRGELHVGYAPSPTARILPTTLRAFQAELPNVRVRLHDLSTEELLEGLRADKLQIALLVRPAPAMLRGLRFTDLAHDKLCLAVAPKHPLARKRVVTVAEIAREPLVVYSRSEYPDYHESLMEFFASAKVGPHIVEEHDGVTSMIAAVESGVGVALLAESVTCMAGPRLKLIPVSPPLKPMVIGAAMNATHHAPAAEQFLKCAKAVAQK
jgi:DNA-binding transcriptional LysR family regulator